MSDITGLAEIVRAQVRYVGITDGAGVEISADRQPVAMVMETTAPDRVELKNENIVAFPPVVVESRATTVVLFDDEGSRIIAGELAEARDLIPGDFVFFSDGELVVPMAAP